MQRPEGKETNQGKGHGSLNDSLTAQEPLQVYEEGLGLDTRLPGPGVASPQRGPPAPQISFLGSGSCKQVDTWCPIRHG